MNVYVMTDIEGISGVYCKEQVLNDGARFSEGRRYITEDINACVRGLRDAGVDKIYVHDCHGGSYSVVWENLSSDADYYICGNMGNDRFACIDDCDAVILLGYHAMAGTKGAILEHTMSSKGIQNIRINGINVGEIAIDAGIWGDNGKPVIMVSGDDKACAEAKKFLPDVVTAEVKKGVTCGGGMLLPMEKAHEIIRAKAKEAVAKYKNISPLVFKKPIDFQVELVERGAIPNTHAKPYMTVIDGRTYEVRANSVEEALFRALN